MEMHTQIRQCPYCQSAIVFSHLETNIFVCKQCSHAVWKTDFETIEKTWGVIKDSNDLIQVGSTGIFNSKKFTVIGRFRIWTSESVYNYWTIVLEDNMVAFLAEGYGLYAIHEAIQLKDLLESKHVDHLEPGHTRIIENETYLLLRNDKCIKWEVEGELQMPYTDNTFKIIDFVSEAGNNIELFCFFNEPAVVYKITHVGFQDLQLKQLNATDPISQRVDCINCTQPTFLKAYPYTKSYSCEKCGTRYVLNKEGKFSAHEKDKVNQNSSTLPLWKTGIVKGITYEVIGYALKEEVNKYKSRWKEYTLYNKQEGFAFLSEYNGHWLYVRERQTTPVLLKKDKEPFTYEGEQFLLFNAYTYKTLDSLGEFPYNVFANNGTDVREYISPPEIWIKEQHGKNGICWFHGEYIEGQDIASAFDISVPHKIGVGAAEPKGYISPNKLLLSTAILACIMILIHLAFGFTRQNRELIKSSYLFGDSASTISYVTPKFHFEKWKSNVEIEVRAPVNNSWFELDGTLVNADNGTEYAFEEGFEYYEGDSEGEHWTEGERSGTVYLSSIPAGNYFLQLQGVRSATDFARPNLFTILAKYDTQQHKNIIVLILALLIWPLLKYITIYLNERKRWSDSPFSTYDA